MIVHVLILGGVIAAAAALGVVAHRRRAPDEAPEYQSSLTFVWAAYGLLLGLLVVFAVGHYTDVRHEAQAEASTLVVVQDAVRVYPPETSDPVRHDVLCYMRSIAHDEWPSMERGKDTPARRTLGLGDRVGLPTPATFRAAIRCRDPPMGAPKSHHRRKPIPAATVVLH